jgi:hypothetical protein
MRNPLQKVKREDNENSMKENVKRGCKSPKTGSEEEKYKGGIDLLIGMAVPFNLKGGLYLTWMAVPFL